MDKMQENMATKLRQERDERPMSAMEMEMGNLSGALEVLESDFSRLVSRLSPVLRNDPNDPGVRGTDTEADVGLSPLVGSVQAARDRVTALNGYVAEVTRRLDV